MDQFIEMGLTYRQTLDHKYIKNLSTLIMNDEKSMTMDVYDTIIAIIDCNDGQISGRTAIHKLAFFIDQLIPEIEIPPHKPHFYGPFNEEIAVSLEKLVSYSFLEERKIPGYRYDSYQYRLTPDGGDMARTLESENPTTYRRIDEIIETCNDFCGLRAAPLSYAAKIYYMLKMHPGSKMTYEDAVNEGKKLDWNLSQSNAEQGVKLLERLHLVKSITK